ncbi:zinc-binding dehydrogenase [Leucobacter sp. wl10]|uniref:zinc-binding dehydrogenase n=1 Tax=Leucobacter sp. wl10 TaxID=2304677 RepID=UPI000E5A7C83|nr:zinc-binding dehydrogenase [Leucobacter sp. wl10]RGE20080.1 NAD(P)H-quinone oxidoreductase [Leucobacter sp. wl10]
MRAVTITEDHRLELAELPEPIPAEGEVLVDVVAAGVNRADLAQASGKYPPPPGASPLPGLEVSGRRRDTGEEVVALLAGGGYAEVVAVPEEQLLPAPPSLPLADAGGLVEVAATVVSNLVIEAGLGAGAGAEGADADGAAGGSGSPTETLLVHGGTGGIGSFAIQFARALGARVLAVAGSDEAIVAARELGAEQAWNRRTTDLVAAVREAGGADIVLDVVGGSILDDNVRVLREFGRVVVIGTLGGSRGELDLGALMAKRARIIGTTLRSRAPHDKRRILRRTRELVWPMLADGSIRLPVQAHLPLAEAARAHEILAAGGHLGKVILDVAE